MKSMIRLLPITCFQMMLLASVNREFGGEIQKESPTTGLIAIEKVYRMFSNKQLHELRKESFLIVQYNLASWIENNWLATEDAPLYVWFVQNGIKVRSSMCLFIIRGFQFRLFNRKFNIAKELKNPSWNRVPPSYFPPPTPQS